MKENVEEEVERVLGYIKWMTTNTINSPDRLYAVWNGTVSVEQICVASSVQLQ